MKKILPLLLLIIVLGKLGAASNNPASPRLLSGKIVDKLTGEALAGVKIQVKNSDNYCYTDLNGNFMISVNVNPKTELSIDLVGYMPTTVKTQDLSLSNDLQLEPR